MQYSDVAIAYFNQLRLCWWFQNIYQYIFPGKKKKGMSEIEISKL